MRRRQHTSEKVFPSPLLCGRSVLQLWPQPPVSVTSFTPLWSWRSEEKKRLTRSSQLTEGGVKTSCKRRYLLSFSRSRVRLRRKASKWSDVTIGTGVAAAECARERFKYLKVCSVTLCPSASVSHSCITDIRMYYAWFKGRGATINTNGSNLLSVILTSPPFSLSLSPAEPLPLMDLCRRAARLALGRERLQEIESLPLPQSLKNYLQYQWLTPAEPTGSTRTQTRPPERLKMDGWKRLIKEKGLLDGRMSTLMDL